MPAQPLVWVMSSDPAAIRSHVRETEQAARRLIARAAHLEKRARRSRPDSAESISLNERARDLRADADALLVQISELARQVTAA